MRTNREVLTDLVANPVAQRTGLVAAAFVAAAIAAVPNLKSQPAVAAKAPVAECDRPLDVKAPMCNTRIRVIPAPRYTLAQ